MRRYIADVVLLLVSDRAVPDTIRLLEYELKADQPYGNSQIQGHTWIQGATFLGKHPSKNKNEYRVTVQLVVETNVGLLRSHTELAAELPDELFYSKSINIRVKHAAVGMRYFLGRVCDARFSNRHDANDMHVRCGFDWYMHAGYGE